MVALKRLKCTAEFLKLGLNETATGLNQVSPSDTAGSAGLPCCLGRRALHCCSCTSTHQPSCSHPLTIIGYIRNLESFGTVPFIRFELDPQFLRPGSESYGALVGLAGLIRGHWVGRSFQSKHTIGRCVTMFRAKELLEYKLNYHEKNAGVKKTPQNVAGHQWMAGYQWDFLVREYFPFS